MSVLAQYVGQLRRKALVSGAFAVTLSLAVTPAFATPTYAFQQTLAIPGVASFSGYDLAQFDVSDQLYYLTDRSNGGIDVYSAKTNTFMERLGGASAGSPSLFSGTQGGNNDVAGPNGISISNTSSGKLLLAGNTGDISGASGTGNVIAFNLDTTGLNVVGTPRTFSTATATTPTPAQRVDGVAYAPDANTILAANNASNPGFLTLINNASGSIIKTLLLNGQGNTPNVGGNGVEATVYNTVRNSFFVAVPTLSVDGGGNPADAGGVIEVSATTGNILNTFDFNTLGLPGACSPTGLAQGAGASMFVACSDPTASGSIVLDPSGTGSITVVPGIRGGDEAVYDPTLNAFYEAARFQPGGPVLGIVDAATFALQTLAIGGNDHSVAVDPVSGEVYVATAATTAFPNCSGGCIGVFTPVPKPGSLPVLAAAVGGMAIIIRRRRRT